MMYCDARSIYVLKTMRLLEFGEIFRGAERAIITQTLNKYTIVLF